jgi:hypothetical protein
MGDSFMKTQVNVQMNGVKEQTRTDGDGKNYQWDLKTGILLHRVQFHQDVLFFIRMYHQSQSINLAL